jgi:hypothetical protein
MSDKYFCRNCKGERNHKTLFSVERTGSEEYIGYSWTEEYAIIECLGCENISFLNVSGDSDMVEFDDFNNTFEYLTDKKIYPYCLTFGKELEHIWDVPISIRDIYKETIEAFKADLFLLTAGGLRAIIEATCNHLEIKNESLQKRIDLLQKKEFLTKAESKRLHSIRFLGNDALHEMEKPKKEQLYILLGIVNHLLENLFIQDKQIEGLVDTEIDDYKEFTRKFRQCLRNEMIDKELSLKQILGKSSRLFSNENLKKFEEQFVEDVESGKYKFVSVERKEELINYKVITAFEFSF